MTTDSTLRDAAERVVAYLEERFLPDEPKSVAETGVDAEMLCDLLLKNVYRQVAATGAELAAELGLPFAGVTESLIESLRGEQLIAVRGGSGVGEASYELAITAEGRTRARELLERSQYTGVAPVPLQAYCDAVWAQSLGRVTIPEEAIREGMSGLVFDARVLNHIGPAINSGRAVFIHGHPGNGKTALANAIGAILPGAIYIPHVIAADSSIIRVFDPHHHKPVADGTAAGEGARAPGRRPGKRYDHRWVQIRRPSVTAGGELVLSSLDLVFDPVAKTHEAPYQMKAAGGMFLIDDFGRQMMRPRDLLNRWIMPLERRVDYLTLNTGKKIEVPFDALIIFSTNLDPNELVDEAFLRRIPHKLELADPSFDAYREIFKRNCAAFNIAYDESMLVHLLREHYLKVNRPLRAVHPRDLLQQISDIARYRRGRPTLTTALIDEACRNYFM